MESEHASDRCLGERRGRRAAHVVRRVLLARDQLLGVEQLAVRAGADLVDHGGLVEGKEERETRKKRKTRKHTSRSRNTARGTCLPAPVSEKKVLNASSPPPERKRRKVRKGEAQETRWAAHRQRSCRTASVFTRKSGATRERAIQRRARRVKPCGTAGQPRLTAPSATAHAPGRRAGCHARGSNCVGEAEGAVSARADACARQRDEARPHGAHDGRPAKRRRARRRGADRRRRARGAGAGGAGRRRVSKTGRAGTGSATAARTVPCGRRRASVRRGGARGRRGRRGGGAAGAGRGLTSTRCLREGGGRVSARCRGRRRGAATHRSARPPGRLGGEEGRGGARQRLKKTGAHARKTGPPRTVDGEHLTLRGGGASARGADTTRGRPGGAAGECGWQRGFPRSCAHHFGGWSDDGDELEMLWGARPRGEARR